MVIIVELLFNCSYCQDSCCYPGLLLEQSSLDSELGTVCHYSSRSGYTTYYCCCIIGVNISIL